jgi:hypothetical protein
LRLKTAKIHKPDRLLVVEGGLRPLVLLFGIALGAALGGPFAVPLAAQETGSIPDVITRPQRGEQARYPRDTVIGELGPGEAPADVYRIARNILTAALRNNRESPLFQGFGSVRLAEIFSGVEAVQPEKFRIGGGRIMPDGSVSFLFRFIGREKGVAGELYLRRERPAEPAPADAAGENPAPEEAAPPVPQGPWRFDDMLLDETHDTQVRREVYPYDFTPYERFY